MPPSGARYGQRHRQASRSPLRSCRRARNVRRYPIETPNVASSAPAGVMVCAAVRSQGLGPFSELVSRAVLASTARRSYLRRTFSFREVALGPRTPGGTVPRRRRVILDPRRCERAGAVQTSRRYRARQGVRFRRASAHRLRERPQGHRQLVTSVRCECAVRADNRGYSDCPAGSREKALCRDYPTPMPRSRR